MAKYHWKIEEALNTFPDWRTPLEPRWSVHRGLHQRQLGAGVRFGSNAFTHGFIRSLRTIERLQPMANLGLHKAGTIESLSFNATGSKVISASSVGEIAIWNWAAESLITNFDSNHEGSIFQVKFVPLSDDRRVLTAGRDGAVRLADLASHQGHLQMVPSREVAKHNDAATGLAINNCSPHISLSAGVDGCIFEIDLRTATPNRLLTVVSPDWRGRRKIPIYSVNYHPLNANLFCIAGRDSHVQVYDRRHIAGINRNCITGYCPDHLKNLNHPIVVSAAVFNHNGSELLASYNYEDIIYAFNTVSVSSSNYTHTHRYRGHMTAKNVSYYGVNSEFIVSGSGCGHVYIWEHESEKIVQLKLANDKEMADDDKQTVSVVEVHPELPVLATCGSAKYVPVNDVKIWLPSNQEPGIDGDDIKKVLAMNLTRRWPYNSVY